VKHCKFTTTFKIQQFQTAPKRGIFKSISWLNGSFFSENGSQDQIYLMAQNSPLLVIFFCTSIFYGFTGFPHHGVHLNKSHWRSDHSQRIGKFQIIVNLVIVLLVNFRLPRSRRVVLVVICKRLRVP
jgi:hypothetical protein